MANYNLYLVALKDVSKALISVHHFETVTSVTQLARIVSKAANFLRPRYGETHEDRLEWRSLEAECLLSLARDYVQVQPSDEYEDIKEDFKRKAKAI